MACQRREGFQGGFRGPEPKISSRWRVASERGLGRLPQAQTEGRVAMACREREGRLQGGPEPKIVAMACRERVEVGTASQATNRDRRRDNHGEGCVSSDASAGPNRRSRRDGVSRARGVGARAASAGPNRRSRRDGVSLSEWGWGGFRGPEPKIASRWRVASERSAPGRLPQARTEDRVAMACREREGSAPGGFRRPEPKISSLMGVSRASGVRWLPPPRGC